MSAFAIFTTLVARMGDASMAATQAMISLLSLSFMQAIGIGLAATTLVGRYKGGQDLEAVVRSYRSAPLLALAAAFQLFDAVQIVAGGALRGAGDTRWPFLMQTSLAWALRLPLVWLFAFLLDGGGVGPRYPHI